MKPLFLKNYGGKLMENKIKIGKHYYEFCQSAGFFFGPGHQGIEMVYAGAGQALGKLSLPNKVLDTKKQFVLHPSLMDSALQSPI